MPRGYKDVFSCVWVVTAVLMSALLSACSCSSGDDDDAPSSSTGGDPGSGSGGGGLYDAVTVEPPEVTLTVALGGTASQAYQAFAEVAGEKVEVTDACSWTVDSAFGSMDGPQLVAAAHGGKTKVSASCSGTVGTSDLTLMLEGEVIATPETPATAPDLFDTATVGSDAAKTPVIEYPIDGAMAPQNLPSIEAQWSTAGSDLFHVSMESTYVSVHVYTTAAEALLSSSDWAAVAESSIGDEVTLTVEGLSQASPATKFVSSAVDLGISADVIDKTAIYYWASSQGSLMTQVFGNTNAPSPLKADCTSCHSVSRSGSRIGYSRCVGGDCGEIFVGFMRYDGDTMQWVDTVDANGKAIGGSYTTFAPIGYPFQDDESALALVTTSGAHLELYDPDSGQLLPSNVADVSTHGPMAPRSALMAEWSPDGKTVIYASTPNPGQWIDLGTSAIATMSYTYNGGQHVFGEPSFLVSQPITLPSGTYDNFFFPSWSPDGQVVVFNAARGTWRNSGDAAAPGQRLMLMDAKGSWVVDLPAANGAGDLDITWPHWAPGDTKEHYWVVFSSERDYGHRVTAANSNPQCKANGVKQCKQLWIGAVSREAVGSAPTLDPSFPPVWMPGQDIAADNISPYWTVATTEIPD